MVGRGVLKLVLVLAGVVVNVVAAAPAAADVVDPTDGTPTGPLTYMDPPPQASQPPGGEGPNPAGIVPFAAGTAAGAAADAVKQADGVSLSTTTARASRLPADSLGQVSASLPRVVLPDTRPYVAPVAHAAQKAPPLPDDEAYRCSDGALFNKAVKTVQGKRNTEFYFMMEEMKCPIPKKASAVAGERDASRLPVELELSALAESSPPSGGALSKHDSAGLRPEEPTPALSVAESRLQSAQAAPAAVGSPEVHLLWLVAGAVLASMLPLLRLYTRLRREDVLACGMRKAVYDLVLAEPGITAGGVARELGVERRTALHHLAVLQGFGMVSAARLGARLHYYENGGAYSECEKRLRLALANENARRIVGELVRRPAMPLALLAKETGLAKSTISGQFERLEALGILTPERRVAPEAVDAVLAGLPPTGGARPSTAPS